MPLPGYPDLDRPTNYGGASDESDTDESVRTIPLPVGPPPGSRAAQVLEERGSQTSSRTPSAPIESKTVYSSAPVMRDLVKEASVLVPVSVQRHKAMTTRPLVPSVDATPNSSNNGNNSSREKETNVSHNLSSRQPLLEDYYVSDEEADDENSNSYSTASGLAPEEEAYLRTQHSSNENEDDI